MTGRRGHRVGAGARAANGWRQGAPVAQGWHGSRGPPHPGPGQRTPNEAHYGRDTRARSVPLSALLIVSHLEGDRELLVLRLRHGA